MEVRLSLANPIASVLLVPWIDIHWERQDIKFVNKT